MNRVDIWGDLAKRLAKQIMELKAEGEIDEGFVDEDFIINLFKDEIEKFAEERIVVFCFFAGDKNEDISKTS